MTFISSIKGLQYKKCGLSLSLFHNTINIVNGGTSPAAPQAAPRTKGSRMRYTLTV